MDNNEKNNPINLIFPYGNKPEKVGLEISENEVTFTFPINYYHNNGEKKISCYSLNEKKEYEDYRKTILILLRLLSKYRDENEVKNYNKNENNFPIEAYLWIIRDYIENGIYKDSETYYCINGKGKINWKKTIKQGKTFLDNENLVYKDLIKRKVNYNIENQITEIHTFCVQKAISILGFIYGLPPKKFKNIKISDEIKLQWLQILRKELLVSYNDHKISLLKNMIDMLQSQDANKFNSHEFSLVTNDYDYVFERLVDDKFGNVCSSDYNPQGEIKLEDEGISSAGQMRPDTICIDDSGIYIIDSKYYTYGYVGDRKGGTLPDISSINKQITYAQYIQNPLNNLNPNNKEIYNIFLLPKNVDYDDKNGIVKSELRDDLSYIGYANIKNRYQDKYDYIYMFLINFTKLVENELSEECLEEIKRITKIIKK